MEVLIIVDLEADGHALRALFEASGAEVVVQDSRSVALPETRTVVTDLFSHPDGGTHLLRGLVAEGRRVVSIVDDLGAWNAVRSAEVGATVVQRDDLERLPQLLGAVTDVRVGALDVA